MIKLFGRGIVDAMNLFAEVDLMSEEQALSLDLQSGSLDKDCAIEGMLIVKTGVKEIEDGGKTGDVFKLVVFRKTGEILSGCFQRELDKVDEAICCFGVFALVEEIGAKAGDGLLKFVGKVEAVILQLSDDSSEKRVGDIELPGVRV